jgi:hypothetical protein
VLSALPATASGAAQLKKIYSNGGLYEADNKTMRPKMKIGLIHAAVNDIVLAAGALTWYTRSAEQAPGMGHILLSMVMLPALLYSANLVCFV